MSRYKDLTDIKYRKTTPSKDAHGVTKLVFSETLYDIRGSLRPQVLTQDIADVGVVLTGDYIIYIPTNIQEVDINRGDGFYIDDDDVNKEPKWFVSNVPHNYFNHTLLVLKSKI